VSGLFWENINLKRFNEFVHSEENFTGEILSLTTFTLCEVDGYGLVRFPLSRTLRVAHATLHGAQDLHFFKENVYDLFCLG